MTFEAEAQAYAEDREAQLEAGQECWVEDMTRVLGSDKVVNAGGQSPGQERALREGPREGLPL